MTDPITVAYHADYLEPARPAINVKVRRLFDDREYRETFERLAANPAIGEEETEQLAGVAWEMVQEAFWEVAAGVARDLGLGEIESAGRSGGWLVIAAGDPAELEGIERRAWLAGYRMLSDWCGRQVSAAGHELAELLEDMAADRAVAP